MDREPKSESPKYEEYLKDRFIRTPLCQKKLLKNMKGKSKGRKEREMMAMKKKGEKKKGENTKEEEEDGVEDKEVVLIEEEKGEIPMEAKKYKYVRTCIEFNLKKKRAKREERMKEEMDKVKEEMARKEARQPFPTLDLSAEV